MTYKHEIVADTTVHLLKDKKVREMAGDLGIETKDLETARKLLEMGISIKNGSLSERDAANAEKLIEDSNVQKMVVWALLQRAKLYASFAAVQQAKDDFESMDAAQQIEMLQDALSLKSQAKSFFAKVMGSNVSTYINDGFNLLKSQVGKVLNGAKVTADNLTKEELIELVATGVIDCKPGVWEAILPIMEEQNATRTTVGRLGATAIGLVGTPLAGAGVGLFVEGGSIAKKLKPRVRAAMLEIQREPIAGQQVKTNQDVEQNLAA